MFDIPLFPSFDNYCRRPCRPQPPSCQGEYVVRVCGWDSCGNLILSIKRRECR